MADHTLVIDNCLHIFGKILLEEDGSPIEDENGQFIADEEAGLALAQYQGLAVQPADHTVTSPNVTLIQNYILVSVASCTHAQTAGAVSVLVESDVLFKPWFAYRNQLLE